jgi:hypothetical protein
MVYRLHQLLFDCDWTISSGDFTAIPRAMPEVRDGLQQDCSLVVVSVTAAVIMNETTGLTTTA